MMNQTLGIMTLTPETEKSYHDEIARRGSIYALDVCMFSPISIDLFHDTVVGFHFNPTSEQWEKDTFPLPTYIYDRTFYRKDSVSLEAKKIVQQLKNKRNIEFLGYGLPNKWRIYNTLKDHPRLSSFIVETHLVENGKHALSILNEHLDIILKPFDGAHGFSVYNILLDSSSNTITVKTTKKKRLIQSEFHDYETFISFIDHLLQSQTFIAQKRLKNLTSDEKPFDLRAFLQKDENGKWIVIQKGIREGDKQGILTNISAGASLHNYEEWKKRHRHLPWNQLEHQLRNIFNHLPTALESSFAPLFEMGLDIIMDQNDSIWILDMNSKPGRKMVQILNPTKLDELYAAPLKYVHYLQSFSLPTASRRDSK